MSQFDIRIDRDPKGKPIYHVTWPTRKQIRQYRFVVGTEPGLDDAYDGGTKRGTGPRKYVEDVTDCSRGMWIQVDYRTSQGLDHTTPERLP